VAGCGVRLLVLSFYYPPDLSAGSFRTAALMEALVAAAPDARIEVLTALPNRYQSFAVEAPVHETHGNVSVDRFPLPLHKSGMLDQSHSFLAFTRQVLRHTKATRYDLVYATSSRLLTAALGAWIARRTRAVLYLDIRDIFVDTIRDVLPARIARLATPVFALLERWTMRRAQHINLVSHGFAEYFRNRYPQHALPRSHRHNPLRRNRRRHRKPLHQRRPIRSPSLTSPSNTVSCSGCRRIWRRPRRDQVTRVAITSTRRRTRPPMSHPAWLQISAVTCGPARNCRPR